jgi:lipoate-protein ligase A
VTVDRAPAVELIERATRWLDATVADGRPRAAWSWATDAAVVLGSAQRLDGWAPPPPYGLVRRGTGGGAVICDPDYLMLDVVLPASDARVADDLAHSYAWLAEGLLDALAARGARGLRAVSTAEVRAAGEDDRQAGRLACWAALGPWEIVDAEGRKLVGLAQRRRRGAALFQAALYLGGTREPLAGLLPLAAEERASLRARLARVATLDAVDGLAPGFADDPPAIWRGTTP